MKLFCLPTTGLAIEKTSHLSKGRNKYSREHTSKKQRYHKIRRLSLMVYYDDEAEEVKPKKGPKKVYLIIDGEKVYIDPEVVKKYGLDKQKVSFFTGRKLYVEKK